MNHARGDDRSCIGGACHCLSPDEGLEVDRLGGCAGHAERILELLPVAGIGQEQSRCFSPLLLQSLQDQNAASAAGHGKQ